MLIEIMCDLFSVATIVTSNHNSWDDKIVKLRIEIRDFAIPA